MPLHDIITKHHNLTLIIILWLITSTSKQKCFHGNKIFSYKQHVSIIEFYERKNSFSKFLGNKIISNQRVLIIEFYEANIHFLKVCLCTIIKSDRHRYVCWSNYKQTRMKEGIGTTFFRQLSLTLQLLSAFFPKNTPEGGYNQ